MHRAVPILVEETPAGRVQHELRPADSSTPIIFEIVRENGRVSISERQSDTRSTALALINLTLPGLSLTALVEDIVVLPVDINEVPPREKEYYEISLNPGDSVRLRPEDFITLDFNSPAQTQFRVKISSPEPDVEVGSSIASNLASTSRITPAAMAVAHTNLDISNVSVEVSRSTLDDASTGTPRAAISHNLIPETPATSHKIYDALAGPSDIPQSPIESQEHNSSRNSSRNDTQIKAEEESQLASRLFPSSPPGRMPSANLRKEESHQIITDSFTCDLRQTTDDSTPPHSNIETTERDRLDSHIDRALDQADIEYSTSLETPKAGHIKAVDSGKTPLATAATENDDETESEAESIPQEDEECHPQQNPQPLKQVTSKSNQFTRHDTTDKEIEQAQHAATNAIEPTQSDGIEPTTQACQANDSKTELSDPPQTPTTQLAASDMMNSTVKSDAAPEAVRGALSSPVTKKRRLFEEANDETSTPLHKKVKTSITQPSEIPSHARTGTSGSIVSVVIPTPAKSIRPSPSMRGSKENLKTQVSPRSGSTVGSKRKTTAGPSSRSSIKLGSPIPSLPSPTLGRRGRSASKSMTPSPSPTPIASKGVRVIFSNSTIDKKSSIMKFFKDHGGKVVDKATQENFDILVVGNGELKKTSKFLLSIALGKHIVTDSWLAQSAKANDFLNITDYVPNDPFREKAWRISLKDVMGKSRRSLFAGRTILVTPALKREYGISGYAEIEELARVAGAKNFVSKKSIKDVESGTIVLACDRDDMDAGAMMESGTLCYNKELLSLSILRGNLDLQSDEFKIAAPARAGPASPERKKRGRPRKSE